MGRENQGVLGKGRKTDHTTTYPMGRIQIKQGKGTIMFIAAAATPQGASTPPLATTTHLGRYVQGEQGKGTNISATVAAAPQGASVPALAMIVRHPFKRDTVSCSRHGIYEMSKQFLNMKLKLIIKLPSYHVSYL